KACDVLLAALARLRDRSWTLTIAGAGSEETHLRAIAGPFAERVHFLGRQPPARIPELLAASDVLVLPSLKESFGVVVIEALPAGVPVLATRCGGPEDILTESTGRLVPPADVDALSAGLAWMLDNHRSFSPVALRAYAAERFGFESVA